MWKANTTPELGGSFKRLCSLNPPAFSKYCFIPIHAMCQEFPLTPSAVCWSGKHAEQPTAIQHAPLCSCLVSAVSYHWLSLSSEAITCTWSGQSIVQCLPTCFYWACVVLCSDAPVSHLFPVLCILDFLSNGVCWSPDLWPSQFNGFGFVCLLYYLSHLSVHDRIRPWMEQEGKIGLMPSVRLEPCPSIYVRGPQLFNFVQNKFLL